MPSAAKVKMKKVTQDVVEYEALMGSGTKFGFYSWYNEKTFKGLKQGGSMM